MSIVHKIPNPQWPRPPIKRESIMKDIKLTDGEVYFLAYQMQKLWEEYNNRYAKSIYDKTKILLDEAVKKINTEDNFKREYECHWIKEELTNE